MATAEPDIGLLLTTPPPAISQQEALFIAESTFGITGSLKALTSERDANFLLRTDEGKGYVLKFTNEMEPQEQTDFQTKALLHLEKTAPSLHVPRAVSTLSGEPWLELENGSRARLLSYVEGSLSSTLPKSVHLTRAIAAAGAKLVNALKGFEHPGADHYLIWDIKNTGSLCSMLPQIEDRDQRELVETVVDAFDDKIAPHIESLPWQVIHGDMNPQNLVFEDENDLEIGVLDFGDMVHSPRICELAIAAGYQLDFADVGASLGQFLAHWHSICPLTRAEVELAADFIAARFATIITVANWRAQRYPENRAYITRNLALASTGIKHLTNLDRNELYGLLKDTAEMKPHEEIA
ncbi:phosphotransferase [uncultured Cohaesibacter sp.]|uniref:phosphotransferase n=1 Tax=uncultured Cohaesibacter sp. TaxID=1002546 RepID=UPI002AA90AF3|nr:phosphotransferase [uncultured Cohaesibacter sp.]